MAQQFEHCIYMGGERSQRNTSMYAKCHMALWFQVTPHHLIIIIGPSQLTQLCLHFLGMPPYVNYQAINRLKRSLGSRPPHSVRVIIVCRRQTVEKLKNGESLAWAETSREGRRLVGVARNFQTFLTLCFCQILEAKRKTMGCWVR